MADPATLSTIATVASIASAGAGVIGGMQGRKSAEIEGQQFEEERENARIAAVQDEAQRRRELQRVLASQEAIRAGRGLTTTSGSAKALRKNTISEAEKDIRTSQINFASQQRRFGLGASSARRRGRAALVGGFADAAGTLGTTDLSAFESS